MNKRKVVLAIAVAVVLIIVGLVVFNLSHKTPSATPQNPTTSPTQTTPDSGTSLKTIHSPGAVADDVDLKAGQCHVRTVDAHTGKYLPDATCTPGAIDPAVTQDTIDSTICKTGYTDTIRPSASKTNKFKELSLSEYGVKADSTVEYDHLISLQLGGANAVSNLWVEPNKDDAKGTTNPKDAVETKLKVAVCKRTVLLADAQKAIATDWTTAEAKLGIKS